MRDSRVAASSNRAGRAIVWKSSLLVERRAPWFGATSRKPDYTAFYLVEFADYRPERPRRCLKDIEVLKQHDAIRGDIEDSGAHSPATRACNHRAEERLEEVELNSVASRCNRDGVAEIAVSLCGVKSGDLGSWLGISNKGDAPLDEVILPAPACAVAICEIRSMSGKPGRLQPSRRTRGQFQRTHECRPPPTRKKLQVKLAV